MYFTDDGFVISGREIFTIIVAITISITVIQMLRWILHSYQQKIDDYPDSMESRENYKEGVLDKQLGINSDIDLDKERRNKVIFEEKISGVIFRYDEETRVLTIGNRRGLTNTDIPPVEVRLESFNEFREFVDRLEEYVNE
jgi:hypothetical protein